MSTNTRRKLFSFIKVALDVLTSFVTPYLCKRASFSMTEIKTKKGNRLACENDMRLALSKTNFSNYPVGRKKNSGNCIDTKWFVIICSCFCKEFEFNCFRKMLEQKIAGALWFSSDWARAPVSEQGTNFYASYIFNF